MAGSCSTKIDSPCDRSSRSFPPHLTGSLLPVLHEAHSHPPLAVCATSPLAGLEDSPMDPKHVAEKILQVCNL